MKRFPGVISFDPHHNNEVDTYCLHLIYEKKKWGFREMSNLPKMKMLEAVDKTGNHSDPRVYISNTSLNDIFKKIKLSNFLILQPRLYLFILSHVCILVWMHGLLCYTLVYNPVLPSVFCWSKCFSFGHWEILQWAAHVFLWHIPITVFLNLFEHFLAFWHYKMLQSHLVNFLVSCLKKL